MIIIGHRVPLALDPRRWPTTRLVLSALTIGWDSLAEAHLEEAEIEAFYRMLVESWENES